MTGARKVLAICAVAAALVAGAASPALAEHHPTTSAQLATPRDGNWPADTDNG
jgi:hypothetical protein